MNAAAEPNLLFNWGPPRPRVRALVIFIFLSLLLHALCFYVFQIIYPPTIALLPPPAHVSFVGTKSDDERAFLRWLDAEDPALTSMTVRAQENRARLLPKIEHVPSYMDRQVTLKKPPALVVDLRPPSPQPPGPVPTSNRAPARIAAKTPTMVEFSEEIATLGAPNFPPTKFEASTKDQPENARFRIAVNERGEVQYSFPLNSSGDAALNEQARRHIALTRFPARSTSDLVWGVATVEFGNDIARSTTPARSADSGANQSAWRGSASSSAASPSP